MPEADINKQDVLQVDEETSNITPTSPPPPPVPSTDPRLISQARTPPPPHAVPTESSFDLFKLAPSAALKLLCAGMESLVAITGDVPPTPPPACPTAPNMSGMQEEKAAIVRSHSEKNLARLRQQQQQQPPSQPQAGWPGSTPGFFDTAQFQSDGSAQLQPPPHSTPQPYIIIGEHSQPLNMQHSAITRKFYSKTPPPIGIRDYLMRIHRFCPMSTAVYLATSLYIFRLAVEERAIPVTRRNCHRLVLAGLRVAMKALEDLSYPHGKIARVGGVSEVELARLEINFCFLVGFELVINEESLRDHWQMLKQYTSHDNTEPGDGVAGIASNMKLGIRRKKDLPITGKDHS
ncbi:cyclin-domain-containing protein [Xylaria intraflava]|nr:cyclin-domain-containing protein [Xylaria intraflava]